MYCIRLTNFAKCNLQHQWIQPKRLMPHDLWCPSSKTALLNTLSDTLGTEHLCHLRRQCHIRLLITEPCTFTMAGSYSRCIMVIIFGQSVMNALHPRWNCATQRPRTTLRCRIEPSWNPTESNCCTTIGSI